MITLTEEQRTVLNHVVMDADKWIQSAITNSGEEKAQVNLLAKVERWQPIYLAEKEKLGENYKTRAEREVK
jgi:hypothetical protein